MSRSKIAKIAKNAKNAEVGSDNGSDTNAPGTATEALSDLLSIRMPRCSICTVNWYIEDDVDGNGSSKKRKTRAGQSTKEDDPKWLKSKCRGLIPLPRCECTTKLSSGTLSSHAEKNILDSASLQQRRDSLSKSKKVKTSKESKSDEDEDFCTVLLDNLTNHISSQPSLPTIHRHSNKAMCRPCLIKTISTSNEVLEHDYRDTSANGQRNVKFTVEPKCVSCRQKFTARKLEKLVNFNYPGGKSNGRMSAAAASCINVGEWTDGVRDTVELVRFWKRVSRVLKRNKSFMLALYDNDDHTEGNASNPGDGDNDDSTNHRHHSRRMRSQIKGKDDYDEEQHNIETKKSQIKTIVRGWLENTEDNSSDECFTDSDNDDNCDGIGSLVGKLNGASKKHFPFQIEPKKGEIKAELLKRDSKFRQECEDREFILAKTKTKEGRRELGLDSEDEHESVNGAVSLTSSLNQCDHPDSNQQQRKLSGTSRMMMRAEQLEVDEKLAKKLQEEFDHQLRMSLKPKSKSRVSKRVSISPGASNRVDTRDGTDAHSMTSSSTNASIKPMSRHIESKRRESKPKNGRKRSLIETGDDSAAAVETSEVGSGNNQIVRGKKSKSRKNITAINSVAISDEKIADEFRINDCKSSSSLSSSSPVSIPRNGIKYSKGENYKAYLYNGSNNTFIATNDHEKKSSATDDVESSSNAITSFRPTDKNCGNIALRKDELERGSIDGIYIDIGRKKLTEKNNFLKEDEKSDEKRANDSESEKETKSIKNEIELTGRKRRACSRPLFSVQSVEQREQEEKDLELARRLQREMEKEALFRRVAAKTPSPKQKKRNSVGIANKRVNSLSSCGAIACVGDNSIRSNQNLKSGQKDTKKSINSTCTSPKETLSYIKSARKSSDLSTASLLSNSERKVTSSRKKLTRKDLDSMEVQSKRKHKAFLNISSDSSCSSNDEDYSLKADFCSIDSSDDNDFKASTFVSKNRQQKKSKDRSFCKQDASYLKQFEMKSIRTNSTVTNGKKKQHDVASLNTKKKPELLFSTCQSSDESYSSPCNNLEQKNVPEKDNITVTDEIVKAQPKCTMLSNLNNNAMQKASSPLLFDSLEKVPSEESNHPMVDDSLLSKLIAMGFQNSICRRALIDSNNDLKLALTMILSEGANDAGV